MKIKEKIYIVLNKPKNYVCALKDNLHLTVTSLIKEEIKGLHIVGRLDIDTTGILILTNDGQYTHNATHPKKHVKKVYQVKLEKPFDSSKIEIIEEGMKIDHGQTQLKPAKIKVLDEYNVELEISEGKFHQVKKMFAALDNHVLELHRVIFDKYDLRDFELQPGEYKII